VKTRGKDKEKKKGRRGDLVSSSQIELERTPRFGSKTKRDI
jgi:hypothetical protein